jgi:hypothetical protein
VRTRHLQSVTQGRLATTNSRSGALSPFGPAKAGSTISRITRDQALTELLNSLENVVADLNYKSFTALDTLHTAIQGVRVALYNTATEEAGTDTV